MKTPRLSGYPLASLARLARSKVGGIAIRGILRGELKVGQLSELPDSLRGDVPLDTRALQARPPRRGEDAKLATSESGWAPTSASFASAYRAGRVTPREVVSRALDLARSLAAQTPSVGPILDYTDATALEEADAS